MSRRCLYFQGKLLFHFSVHTLVQASRRNKACTRFASDTCTRRVCPRHRKLQKNAYCLECRTASCSWSALCFVVLVFEIYVTKQCLLGWSYLYYCFWVCIHYSGTYWLKGFSCAPCQELATQEELTEIWTYENQIGKIWRNNSIIKRIANSCTGTPVVITKWQEKIKSTKHRQLAVFYLIF